MKTKFVFFPTCEWFRSKEHMGKQSGRTEPQGVEGVVAVEQRLGALLN